MIKEILTQLIAMATVLGPIAWKVLYEDKKAAQRTNFVGYAQRFAEVCAFAAQVGPLDKEFESENPDHRAAALKLFFLLSEEEYLARVKLVDTEVWKVWAEGVSQLMRYPFVQGAWKYSEKNFVFDARFVDWINAIRPPTNA